MIVFFVPEDVPDGVKALSAMVRPPNWKRPDSKSGRTSIDDRIDFMSALTRAVGFIDKYGSTKLLNGLRALYPEAVTAFLPEAEAKARSARNHRNAAVA